MRTHVLALFLLALIVPALSPAQQGTWVWMGGDTANTGSAVYGTLGVPDTNNIPDAMYEAPNWTDLDGNFWVMTGPSDDLGNTLWKYNPPTRTWTWVNGPQAAVAPPVYGIKGVPAPGNIPGARSLGSISWTDNVGDLWLFGGSADDVRGHNGGINDLWRYHIATNEWTWMTGSDSTYRPANFGTLQVPSPTNEPGSRFETNAGWVDCSNRLWMFGGIGAVHGNAAQLNDMWRYDIASNIWTWMKGDSGSTTTYNYGTMGVEAASNLPRARYNYTRWKDAEGNFYIWAGLADTLVSDVWKFNPVTNNWTWVAGPPFSRDSGDYLRYCIDSGQPMARFESRTAQVMGSTNVFVGFGGAYGCFCFGNSLSDLWTFNALTYKWKWLSGTNVINDGPGSYGTRGVPASSNHPPGVMGQCVWIDTAGAIWMMGGVVGPANYISNALWKFIPDPSCLDGPLSSPVTVTGPSSYQLSRNHLCSGDTALLTLTGISQPHVTPTGSLIWIDSTADSSHIYLFPQTTTTYTITGNTFCSGVFNQQFTITASNTSVVISGSTSPLCPGDSAKFCARSVADIYLWSSTDTTACIEATRSGTYQVTVTDANGCTALSNQLTLVVDTPQPVSVTVSHDTLRVNNEGTQQWYLNGNIMIGDTGKTLIAVLPGNYTVQVTDSLGCTATSSVQSISLGINNIDDNGIYLYPNPATKKCSLQLTGTGQYYSATIIDLTGREVQPLFNHQQITTFNFSIANLTTGIYFIQITSNQGNVAELKLVKK